MAETEPGSPTELELFHRLAPRNTPTSYNGLEQHTTADRKTLVNLFKLLARRRSANVSREEFLRRYEQARRAFGEQAQTRFARGGAWSPE